MCSAIPRPRLVLRSAWPQAWRKAWRLHFALAVAVALLCCGPFGPFGPFGSYVATFASGSSESRREVLGALLGAGLTPTPARAESVIKQMASESRKLSDELQFESLAKSLRNRPCKSHTVDILPPLQTAVVDHIIDATLSFLFLGLCVMTTIVTFFRAHSSLPGLWSRLHVPSTYD